MSFPWYTDAEIDDLCAGYTTNAAKARHLERLGLTVHRKPNGRPLVIRAHAEAVLAGLRQVDAAQAPQPTGARPDKAAMVMAFHKRRGVA